MDLKLCGGDTRLKKTAVAGTAIRMLVPPKPNFIARLVQFVYAALGTAHVLTVLRSLGRTTARAAAAAGQAVVTVAAEMGPSGNLLAANDLVAAREVDGITRLYVVSAVPSSYPGDVTMTGSFTAGLAAGADLWNFGITSDTDPKTGLAHQTADLTLSATTTLNDSTIGIARSHAPDEPLLLSVDNATTAGALILGSFAYSPEA